MAYSREAIRVKEDPRGTPLGEPEAVRVELLGGFRVSVGSLVIEVSEWRLRKAASLVKLLALAPAHRMHRERVMDLLWPNLDPRAAANNLRYTLYKARRILGPAQATAASHYLHLRGDLLALCPNGNLCVNVEAFEEAAARGGLPRRSLAGSGVRDWQKTA